MQSDMTTQLGKRYRDTISGTEGIATARTTYLYGCVRVCLENLDEKGQPQDVWFDEQRLVDQNGDNVATDAKAGGPRSTPVRFGAR